MDTVWYLRLFYFPILNFFLPWLPAWIIKAKRMDAPELNKPMITVYIFVFFGGVVLMWFVPFKINLAFCIGVCIMVIGHVVNSFACSAMREHPEKKKVVVDWGIYRFSRHPHILHMVITLLGTIVMGWNLRSMMYALLWIYFVIYVLMYHFAVLFEEKRNLEKFGKEYEEYMNRAPRWIGIPKSSISDLNE